MPKQEVLIGNCLDVLKTLPPQSVDCIITSPPYYGLRDYGTEPVVWDETVPCEHEWEWGTKKWHSDRGEKSKETRFEKWDDSFQSKGTSHAFCKRCGAWKGNLGHEPTPGLFVKHLCDIFDAAKPVLKDTGSLFVNLGDTYAGSGGSGGDYDAGGLREGEPRFAMPRNGTVAAKSLYCIPDLFKVMMVYERGWVCRNELIWHKPSVLPSSAVDRFTVDFEPMYFFTKRGKGYYFEQQREPMKEVSIVRAQYGFGGEKGLIKKETNGGNCIVGDRTLNPLGRNKRTVWSIASTGTHELHYAPFPIELIETPIKATVPRQICSKCGFMRQSLYESVGVVQTRWSPTNKEGSPHEGQSNVNKVKKFVGYSKCECEGNDWLPGTVMDPFAGSGTVLEYARKNGLNAIGIELNPEYGDIIKRRAMAHIAQIDDFVVEPEELEWTKEEFAEDEVGEGEER